MKRPYSFEDIKGHDWLVDYLKEHLQKGTLHHFLIIEGQEGLGKTSLADIIALSLVYGLTDSPEKRSAYENIVVKGLSNDNIKRFKCSENGGKDVALQIKDEMNNTFVVSGNKVIICDECHGLTEAAQDVFLAETEFINEHVYVIMLTTEANKLKASLKSRAVPIHLNPLRQSEMVSVLRREVQEKNLRIQNEEIVLNMIAEWAECKPRTGLNILNAFSDGSAVSMNLIRELIGHMDVTDLIPLLSSLSGSMTFGLNYIAEMQIHSTIIDLVIECIKVKSGSSSYKLKMTDIQLVRDQLINVSTEQLVKFLHGLTKNNTLTRTMVINAYINAHQSYDILTKPNTEEMLKVEDVQRANVQLETEHAVISKAPSIEDLLAESQVID